MIGDFDKWVRPSRLVIDYSPLGTFCVEELGHAIWEDIQIVKQTYGVRYVKGFMLLLPVTNE